MNMKSTKQIQCGQTPDCIQNLMYPPKQLQKKEPNKITDTFVQ